MSWPSNINFTLVDFETTGLHPEGSDRVVEFAYQTIRNGQIIASGQSLVNPNRTMSHGASAVNGITDQMLIGQPTFENAAAELWRAIDGNIFVAHNAYFDLKCFVHECSKVGWSVPQFIAIDTLKLTRKVWKSPNYKLVTLADAIGHRGTVAHRAMADVEMMASVMSAIFKQFPGKFPDLQSLNPFQSKIPIATPTPNHNFSEMGKLVQGNIGRRIKIDYNSSKSGRSIREITPLTIYHNGYNEMINATCHRTQNNKTFRVDRIFDIS
jgi:DNA polymerase III epsilon subunit family exonuclease